MNITFKQLKEFDACESGVAWFKQQKNKEAKSILRKLVVENRSSYAYWYISHLFTQPQAVLFSIYCAELVIDVYEKTNDSKAPRLAIEAAKKWLIDPSETNKSAANAAANAAYAAANAAYAAANAAAYAAANAAYAAANAAYAAANAAAYAAYAAANAEKIIERAIEILSL